LVLHYKLISPETQEITSALNIIMSIAICKHTVLVTEPT
jgi:hypothetical protein